MTQLSSREVSDLLSKLLTQCSKQFWTRFEYISHQSAADYTRKYDVTPYVHEFLHLLLLHAVLQLALFRCRESAGNERGVIAAGAHRAYWSIVAVSVLLAQMVDIKLLEVVSCGPAPNAKSCL